jgi:hypothetical protein
MSDNTLVALAGTGLALWWLSSGATTVGRVSSKLNDLANIYHEHYEDGFDFHRATEKNAQVSFAMQSLLAMTEDIEQTDYHGMTKRDLMNLVRHTIGDEDKGASYFIRTLRNWALMFQDKTEPFEDGPLLVRPEMVPPVRRFVDMSVDVMRDALKMVSEIYAMLPGESSHSGRNLVQTVDEALIRIKFAL